MLGYEVQGFLQFAQRAELLFDVPQLGEALLYLIGAADQFTVTPFELGFDRDQGLQQGLYDSVFDCRGVGLRGGGRCGGRRFADGRDRISSASSE